MKFCIFNISESKQVIFLYVVLSEERGRSARRKPPRDLVTSFGGLLRGCNIFCGKPPKFVRRSHRRYRSSVLPRSPLGKTSTTKSQCDFFAQNDRQRVCFAIIVRGGTPRMVSLRLGLAHVLTVHWTVIHCVRAALLRPLQCKQLS